MVHVEEILGAGDYGGIVASGVFNLRHIAAGVETLHAVGYEAEFVVGTREIAVDIVEISVVESYGVGILARLAEA